MTSFCERGNGLLHEQLSDCVSKEGLNSGQSSDKESLNNYELCSK